MRREQKIAKKRKDRKKLAHERVLRRRDAIRAERRQETKMQRLEKSVSPKPKPIVNEKTEQERQEHIRKQLLKNQELLKALESAYDKEVEDRKRVHSDLESQGHATLQDKLAAMQKQAVDENPNLSDPQSQAVIGGDEAKPRV